MGAKKFAQRALQRCFRPKPGANSLFHFVRGSCCSSSWSVAKCRFGRVGPPGGRQAVGGGHLGVAGSGGAVFGCRKKVSEVGGVAVGGRVAGHEARRGAQRGILGSRWGAGTVSGCSLACRKLAHKMRCGVGHGSPRGCGGRFSFKGGSEGVAPSDRKTDNAMGKGVLHRGGSAAAWGRGCASWACAFCPHGGRSAGPRVRIKDASAGSAREGATC